MEGPDMLNNKRTMEELGAALDAGKNFRVVFEPMFMLNNLVQLGADIGPAVGPAGRALRDKDRAKAREAAEILLIAAWRNRQDIDAAEPYLIDMLKDGCAKMRETCAKTLVLFHFQHGHFKRMEKLQVENKEYRKVNEGFAEALRKDILKGEDLGHARKVRAYAIALKDDDLAEHAMRRMIELEGIGGRLDAGCLITRPVIRGPPTEGAMCRRNEIKRKR